MKKGGIYKNIKMSLATADILVICAVALLVCCFVLAVSTAGRETGTVAEYSTEIEAGTE